MCYNNLLTELDLSHNPQLEFLLCMFNNLNSLKISNCKELICLHAIFNQLESIDLTGLTNLEDLRIDNNFLNQKLDLSTLNPEKLNYLSIHNNNLPKQDIEIFSRFVNLENL